jgi:general secretion pathway protein K
VDSRRQSGVALITALLVVMLAATIASYLIAQQSEALTRVERARERGQLLAHANTTLDWARSALLAQQRNSTYVSLAQPWAQGLVARPIETATAAGSLADAQARFNINNLVRADGTKSDADVEVFQRLLKELKLSPSLAEAVIDWLDSDDQVTGTNGAENAFYWSQKTPWRAANRPLQQLDELARVRGMTPEVLLTLSRHVTALPLPTNGRDNNVRSRVNFNTATREVLVAIFPDVASDVWDNAIRMRELPYSSVTDIKDRVPQLPAAKVEQFLDVRSTHFEAVLAITGRDSQIRQAALLRLSGNETGSRAANAGWPSIIWVKEL